MRRVLLLVAAIVAVASASAADIANYVEVSGRSEVKVKPNEFTLMITIDEQATRGKYTVEAVEAQMRKAVKRIGLEDDALSMSGISSLAKKRRDALTTASYELKLSSVEQLMECYDAFDELGITSVQLTKATNSDMERYRSEARAAAVRDAVARAKELGDALGQSVGACFELADRSSYANERVYMSYAPTRANGVSDSIEPLEFRDITITYNVDAKFVLGVDENSKQMIIE